MADGIKNAQKIVHGAQKNVQKALKNYLLNPK